jgi:hypothetical protein
MRLSTELSPRHEQAGRQADTLLATIGRMPVPAFFALLFLYQLVFIFQGLDFADEGFHATFYQEIFHDPSSVQYNFMYWFSGIVGGLWMKAFGFLGLWGLRFAGVLVTTLTAFQTFRFLRHYMNKGHLFIGLLLATLFISNDPKELYYNNLSALFYVLIASAFFKGLRQNRPFLLVVAGLLVALNTFTRLPNLLQAGLIAAVFYHGYIAQVPVRIRIRQALLFTAGLTVGLAVIWVIMYSAGHWQLFMNNFNLLMNLAGTTSDMVEGQAKDSSGYYSMAAQLKLFWGNYMISLRYTAYLVAFLLAAGYVTGQARRYTWIKKIMPFVGWLCFFGLCIAVMRVTRNVNLPNTLLLYIFSGSAILIGSYTILRGRNADIRLIAFFGLFQTLSYHVGSSSGMFTAGVYAFWITLPVITDWIYRLRSVQLNGQMQSVRGEEEEANIWISPRQLRHFRQYGLIICLLGCVYSSWNHPFWDWAGRDKLVYSVNSDKLHGIFTSAPRARVINELLEASKEYIKPGDYLLAHDAIPMVHYLTGTRPFLHNSYPWLYQPNVYEALLEQSTQEKDHLPVIIMQKVATNSHRGIRWPENSATEYAQWNSVRNEMLQHYLDRYHYKEVWSNEAFRLFVSENPDSVFHP